MKVKELKTRLGMTRANIRFYEKEGLLRLERRANGYRKYSEADALTLEKISLLRRLEMPVEVIRQVQEGKLPLPEALLRQERALAAMQREMEQARRICGSMLEDQVTYQALEPEKYRNALPPARPSPAQELPTVPKTPALSHWIRRLLARMLDFWLYSCLWYSAQSVRGRQRKADLRAGTVAHRIRFAVAFAASDSDCQHYHAVSSVA